MTKRLPCRIFNESVLCALFSVLFISQFFHISTLQAQNNKPAAAFSFFTNTTYDPAVPTPKEVLGFAIGTRPITYAQLVTYLRTLSEQSPKAVLRKYGQTYEGRDLFYLIISSEKNLQNRDRVRKNIARLADPGKIKSSAEANALIAETPAIAWLAYSIHGDELSSTDAAVQVAYQLCAGTDAGTEKILDSLIVLIDPLQNPDGRERFVHQMQQWRGPVINSDIQSLHHTGTWPYGRGNHYLFDMNRDYVPLLHAETQARAEAVLHWQPQLVVDSHEMGAMDSYLFYPPREPLHPNITDYHTKWWRIFSQDQARAFDRHGWRYYTRDWAESWYPGYTDAWVLFAGAIGILYEQAGVDGSQVKQYDGSILSFQESVQHHFTSSLSNLGTAAAHRQALLRDFFNYKKKAIETYKHTKDKTLILDPTGHASLTFDLVKRLKLLNIKVRKAQEASSVPVKNYWHEQTGKKTFPAGTFFVTLDQPLSPLVQALFQFDPHLNNSSLQKERKQLQKYGRSRIYDVTAWSLPIAYGVQAYWSGQIPRVRSQDVQKPGTVEGKVINPQAAYGYVIDWSQDRAPFALPELMSRGYTVYAASQPFAVQGKTFPRGSLILFHRNNPSLSAKNIAELAKSIGVTVVGIQTGLSEKGPDLGSRRFQLLKQPRIAIAANNPISTTSLGSIWYLLDRELGCKFSLLDINRLGSLDLSLYNVLILPSAWTSPQGLRSLLGKEGQTKLRNWVENGGTLIAIGNSAAFCADTSSHLSSVRLRRQVLDKLELYRSFFRRLQQAGQVQIDSLALWVKEPEKTNYSTPPKSKEKETVPKVKGKEGLREWDNWLQRFRPKGTILRTEADMEHWLCFGAGARVPVIISTGYVYLAKDPVQVPVRFAERNRLRVSGLLWPEARDRWANTAFATRERKGKGQIILFAGEPNFRGYFRAPARLLLNAMLLGPGFGTQPELKW